MLFDAQGRGRYALDVTSLLQVAAFVREQTGEGGMRFHRAVTQEDLLSQCAPFAAFLVLGRRLGRLLPQ